MLKQLLLCLTLTGTVFFSSCKSTASKADWKKIELGTMGLSLEAPFTFTTQDLSGQLTPSVRKMVKKMEMYVRESKKEYYAVSTVEYEPEVTFSMSGAVNGALREMALKSGGKTSNRKDEKTTIDGNEATLTRVTISNLQKEEMELQMAIINKGKKMYQVMGLYELDNTEAAGNTTRMLGSIQIR